MDLLSKNLMTELGLGDLPEERQKEILLTLGRLIQQNVILRVLEELSEKDKSELEKLLAEKVNPVVSPSATTTGETGDNSVYEFLHKKVKNLDGLIEEEVNKLKEKSAQLLK